MSRTRALALALGLISFAGATVSCGGDPPPVTSAVEGGAPRGTLSSRTMTVEGQARSYQLFVPADVPKRAPLVLVMHGMGSTPAQILAATGYNDLAESHGFLVAYPAGLTSNWNAGQALRGGARFDDVGFLMAVVDDVHAAQPVDRRRVYLTGHSAGGWMAYRAACERPDVFAAAAPVGSALMVLCRPSRPVPVLHIHGAADAVIKLTAAVDSVEQMRRADGCAGDPRVTKQGRATRTMYTSCRDGSEVTLAVVTGLEHVWPVPTSGYDATQESWKFFSRHPLPQS